MWSGTPSPLVASRPSTLSPSAGGSPLSPRATANGSTSTSRNPTTSSSRPPGRLSSGPVAPPGPACPQGAYFYTSVICTVLLVLLFLVNNPLRVSARDILHSHVVSVARVPSPFCMMSLRSHIIEELANGRSPK
eukprot:scaffold443017_cov45-Prasinocladus_malaysianus.AAC.2